MVLTLTFTSLDYSLSPCRVPQPLLFVTILLKIYTEGRNSDFPCIRLLLLLSYPVDHFSQPYALASFFYAILCFAVLFMYVLCILCPICL